MRGTPHPAKTTVMVSTPALPQSANSLANALTATSTSGATSVGGIAPATPGGAPLSFMSGGAAASSIISTPSFTPAPSVNPPPVGFGNSSHQIPYKDDGRFDFNGDVEGVLTAVLDSTVEVTTSTKKANPNINYSSRKALKRIGFSPSEATKEKFESYRTEWLDRIPKEIKSRFRECGFSKWGKEWLPVLVMGPFDVEPGPVRDMWFEMFRNVSFHVPIFRD
jgi:hypothetical protein